MAEFRMPSLGSDMQAGTLLEWRVKPGDRVRRRDIIAVVETDKAAIEIEVFEEGVIEALLVQPGQRVAVGTVMAVIRTEEGARVKAFETEKAAPEPATATPPPEAKTPLPAPSAGRPAETTATGRIKASPYARRLAAERGVDLSTLKGTGPGGAVRAADVTGAPGPPAPEPEVSPPPPPAEKPPAARFDPTAMRRSITAAMVRSNREIPHYYLETRIDMSRTLSWLAAENAKRPIKERILPVAALIRAVALSLVAVPELNGHWIDDRHRPAEAIHIGFVVALRQGGIIAPAILNADEKNLDQVMHALRDLITRTRSGGLRSSEMTEATITVTNLGDLGVETVFGLIYPPQVALVGFGKTVERPWAENGMLAVRPVLSATLSADHRATDGHRGAQFLDALNRHLQEPETL